MAEIIIVNPPYGYASGRKPNIDDRGYMLAPLLPYLTEACERNQISVSIEDLPFSNKNLGQLITSIGRHPDCKMVAITSSTVSSPYASAIALAVKKHYPELNVVIGGPHFGHAKHRLCEAKAVDWIVCGEGEFLLPQIYLGEFKSNSFPKGLQKEGCNEDIIVNWPQLIDICEFGFPRYSFITDWSLYNNTASINSSRGCQHVCMYCLIPQIGGSVIRARQPSSVVDEMKFLYNQGVANIDFTDPNLTFDRERMVKICQLLIQEGISVNWTGATRLDAVDEELIRLMHRSGCSNLLFGIESASQESLDSVNKCLEISRVFDTLDMVTEAGLTITPSFIIGFPEDTESSMLKTLQMAQEMNERYKINGDLQFNTLAVYPGGKLASHLGELDLNLIDLDYAYYTIVPQTYNSKCSYETHLRIWHEAWQTLFPEHYNFYCDIEYEALSKGRNKRLESFVRSTIEIELLYKLTS